MCETHNFRQSRFSQPRGRARARKSCAALRVDPFDRGGGERQGAHRWRPSCTGAKGGGRQAAVCVLPEPIGHRAFSRVAERRSCRADPPASTQRTFPTDARMRTVRFSVRFELDPTNDREEHHVTAVIGYTRVSTEEQGRSGLRLEAQHHAIASHAVSKGWEVISLTDEGLSARSLARPALQEALAMLRDGHADALVVSKLDRLSRSVQDFAGLLAFARKQRWAVNARRRRGHHQRRRAGRERHGVGRAGGATSDWRAHIARVAGGTGARCAVRPSSSPEQGGGAACVRAARPGLLGRPGRRAAERGSCAHCAR